MNYLPKYLLVLICLLLAACSGTKYLPTGEKLYTGARVKLVSSERITNKKSIQKIADNAVRPKPNSKFLGMRPKLWCNFKAGEHPKGFFKKWLKRIGEEPVYLSSVKPVSTAAIVDAKLFNVGIFKSVTEFTVIEKKHTAKIIYTSHIHEPFRVQELVNAIADDSIRNLILQDKDKSLVEIGQPYNLDKLTEERIRIDALLKENGYFYFNPDYLLFRADTVWSTRTVSLKLVQKDSIPPNALTPYRINHVYIDQAYSLNTRQKTRVKDTVSYGNNLFLGKESGLSVRPGVISQSVYLRKPELYSRRNHNITLNRLMSIGNFQFVSVKFTDSDTLAPGFLDVRVQMTPMTKRTFRAEIDVVSKSNNYLGPRMNVSLLNRNTFRGAELLNLNLSGSYEAQISGASKNLYSYSLFPQVELYFPDILIPFKIIRTNSLFAPKTRFSLSYNFVKRVNYFNMRTFQFMYGFKWKDNAKREQELNPINVSYTSISNQSEVFTALLAANSFLRKSYEEQFVAGASYSFTYNDQIDPKLRTQYFLHLTTESSGNLLSLIKIIGGSKVSAAQPATIAGSPYSQYVKISIDGRVYFNSENKNKLALRLFAGVAKPFGNSSVLPYSKQFFSGGPNSIRAFYINSVGPGTSHLDAGTGGFLQLGGDLKLETNAEYRFNIFSYFKGALFVDAGNTWLLKSTDAAVIAPFAFSRFLDEIAVGTGVGLRMDVNFFVLRFDLAMPLRKPWLATGNRWVIRQIDFGSAVWRRENLILNIAIGYPF